MSVATIAHLDGVRPIVELGVGASYDDTSTAQWDVDHWDDTDDSIWVGDRPFWLDITCHAVDITTFAGRERATEQFEIGTATVVVDNRTGLFDFPLSMADLANDDTLLSIRPGRSLRIGVQYDNSPPVLLWAGYIDAANPTYDAVEGARLTLECIDAKGDAGRTEIASLELEEAVGAGETVTVRMNRILTAAAWPPYRRSIEGSGVALIATTLGGQTVDLLNRAADSAGGVVFGDLGDDDDGDPRVAFRGRDFLNYANTDPPVGIIGDYGEEGIPAYFAFSATMVQDPAGSGLYYLSDVDIHEAEDGLYIPDDSEMVLNELPPGSGLFLVEAEPIIPAIHSEVCPSSWELSFARSDITTRALLGRPDEVEFEYPTPEQLEDTANGFRYGLSMFGAETFIRNDLETQSNPDLDWLGLRILTTRSWQYMPRVAAVTITGTRSEPQTIQALLGASPYTAARFRCRHRIDTRTVFDRMMMVTAVEHAITPAGWEARISLDDAEPFLVGGAQPALWDLTDVALWDAATWADPI
jgi:hypothetical protein